MFINNNGEKQAGERVDSTKWIRTEYAAWQIDLDEGQIEDLCDAGDIESVMYVPDGLRWITYRSLMELIKAFQSAKLPEANNLTEPPF